MQQNQPLNLPAAPTQYQNPLQQGDMSFQSQTGQNLINGNLPSWLQSTVNPNNSANALQAAQGLLQPQFRDTLQQINNNAAANNQLNSSTYTDALARSQSDLNSQYQSIVSQQAINDSNQANQNKLGLFGEGLNTLQSGIGNEQNQANSTNQFNLQNYGNQVAGAVQQNQNANMANPFTQALSAVNPLAHDYFQSQGISNVPGYGVGQTLGFASSLFGGGLGQSGGGQSPLSAMPGSSASNYIGGQQNSPWNPYAASYAFK